MDEPDGGADRPRRNLYGRRSGKPLRPGQRRLLAELLPRLRMAGVAPTENPDRRPLDPAALFPSGRRLWLEIGFGGGEHLAYQAAAHTRLGLVGCEPFVNGVAMLLGRVEREGLSNVRIHPGDARDLIELMPAGSFDRVFLLYPDPWPKARHHRRRFMNPENLALLHPAMAPGAELRLATDVPDYAEHALEAIALAGGFRASGGPGWREPWPDWPGTRYETKALRAGRRPHYLTFVRT